MLKQVFKTLHIFPNKLCKPHKIKLKLIIRNSAKNGFDCLPKTPPIVTPIIGISCPVILYSTAAVH